MDDHESETEKERIEHVLAILILVATCIEQTKRVEQVVRHISLYFQAKVVVVHISLHANYSSCNQQKKR